MKKSLLSILLVLMLATTLLFNLSSCGGGNKTEEVAEAVYACPMHPKVTGKEEDTCNQCGMTLEKVEEVKHEHTDH